MEMALIDIVWNTAAFIVALGILVTIHEYGHFWVARKLGVKVLTFSIGFGKPFLEKTGKDGVRYVIATIPLGGYVKMLDERDSEQNIPEQDKPFAFNQKSVWVRMAIVLAGPVANFLLAIFLYWCMFILGTDGLRPVVGDVPESSIAFQAGLKNQDLIVAVDGESIVTSQDLVEGLAKRLGDKDFLSLTIQRSTSSLPKILSFNLKNWQVDDEKPQILHSLGIFHPLEDGSTQVDKVSEGKAAAKAGIQVGDVITQVDGIAVNKWRDMVVIISSMPNRSTKIQVNRKGELIVLSVVIGSREDNADIGQLGVGKSGIDVKPYIITQKTGVLDAFGLAIETAYKKILLTVQLFKKLLIGEISHKGISGPLSIAKGAGNSASYGLVPFLGFLAMISVNLGFINLLPVPMLDGGHMLYFIIEAIKGKPLSQKVQEFGLQVGMMMVFALMAIAIYNDFAIH